MNEVIKKVVPEKYLDADTIFHLNPSGRFVIGGPHGDAGLTGRKIIIDTYGGWGAHGGGAFSGKDPTKVDRSGAYISRQAAKSVVAAGLARRCLFQISYAIGVAEPLSVHVDTYGTGKIPDRRNPRQGQGRVRFPPGHDGQGARPQALAVTSVTKPPPRTVTSAAMKTSTSSPGKRSSRSKIK